MEKKILCQKKKLLRNNIMRISATITDTQTHTQTTFYHYQFEKKKSIAIINYYDIVNSCDKTKLPIYCVF